MITPKKIDSSEKKRCFGNNVGQELLAQYHDYEWGIPVHDDQKLFEILLLEGAQAGLTWETILKRRTGYKAAFYDFNPTIIAAMSDQELEALRNDNRIIRNTLKIYAARTNALIFLNIQKEYGSFDHYLWQFVQYKPIINQWQNFTDVPTRTFISDIIAKDLKKRGMKFVGSTIIYAYMQAIGMVNDHIRTCWLYPSISQ